MIQSLIHWVAEKHEVLVLAIIAFFGLIETLGGFYANSKRNRDDVLIETFNTFMLMVFTKPLIVFATISALNWAVPSTDGALSLLPFFVSLVGFLLVDDFLQYWYHRFAHEYKWLWKLHRAHHTATELGLMVSYRNAIYYYMLMPNIWWLGIATYFLGGVPVAVGIVLKQVVIVSSHSLVTWDSFFHRRPWLKPVLRLIERIVVTPAFHHAHHAVSKIDGVGNPNGNFGNMLSIWDQMFSSASFSHAFPTAYGIPNDPQDGWAVQSLYPLIKSNQPDSELSANYQFKSTKVNEPAVMTLQPGDYLYCACGYSRNQPFCDGSHHGTGYQPVKFTVERQKQYRLCQCKLCVHAPYCDNSHQKATRAE